MCLILSPQFLSEIKIKMKISCERDKFSHAFQLAASVAAVRDVKPVLQNVLLKVEKDAVILMATDTEIGIRTVVDGCEIHKPGDAILPTKLVKQILQESSDKTLTITTDGDKTLIQGTKSRWQLPTQSTDEFPEVEPFEETAYHVISSKTFREMIKRTAFATDEDSARYSLGGVHLDFGPDQIGCVATDGRRLAHQPGVAETVNDHKPEGSSIFPVKALTLIERAAAEDEPVKIAVSTHRGIFETEKTVLFTRLIEGKFPRWKSIIPNIEGHKEVEVVAGALLSGVKQAQIVTLEREPGVDFTFSEGKLELSGSGAEVGESSVEIPVSYTGEKISLRLDPKFVTEFLRVFEAEKSITTYLKLEEPVYWKTDDGYEYIVMPIST